MTKKILESKKLENEARERLQTSPLRLQEKRIDLLSQINKTKESLYGTPLTNTDTSAAN